MPMRRPTAPERPSRRRISLQRWIKERPRIVDEGAGCNSRRPGPRSALRAARGQAPAGIQLNVDTGFRRYGECRAGALCAQETECERQHRSNRPARAPDGSGRRRPDTGRGLGGAIGTGGVDAAGQCRPRAHRRLFERHPHDERALRAGRLRRRTATGRLWLAAARPDALRVRPALADSAARRPLLRLLRRPRTRRRCRRSG